VKRAFLVFMLLSATATAAPAPSPSPANLHRHRIAELNHGDSGGPTISERHPWLQRVENFLQMSLVVVLSFCGGRSR
jgi:hypothetical protein